MHLYQHLAQRVADWRTAGYPCSEYPAIAEILNYATLDDEEHTLRLLRRAQMVALETYWYLRLIEKTPHIFELYKRYYTKFFDLLAALSMNTDAITEMVVNEGREVLWQRVRDDETFVKQHHLESVHETLTLDYPSYIFALAMGAGKTMLIGTIIATEFAMALEYPGDACPFVQNALVFAPGLTILESLRELAELRYDLILPPRLYKSFEATYSLIFTRDGEKDVPVIRGSRYNLIVTNTEKIRIQKRAYRHSNWSQLEYLHRLEQAEAEANLRLRAIASLPNLGIFSDEAHHTYGRDIGKDLKRVRQTVDYLHQNTDVVCVVNTTGTPYYERQPLRDVVIWYGLSEGIRDGILKPVEDNIYAYDFDDQHADTFVREVIRTFFADYGNVTLPNGAPARLALYFPQNRDLTELRPVVEATLLELGYPLDIVLRNTDKSTEAEVAAFNRLNDPDSPHRVILLVNKGTEGWNCPSLFACALARKLRTSQNFVLQAASRCLRQIPGNPHKARIYLSMDNRGALDRQLQETYGETLGDLSRTSGNTVACTIRVRKVDIPPLTVTRLVRQVVPATVEQPSAIHLVKPTLAPEVVLVRQTLTLETQPGQASVLQQTNEEAVTEIVGLDLYSAAARLAAVYRLPALALYLELHRLYADDDLVPETHFPALCEQLEAQTRRYAIEEIEVEDALALLKVDGGGFQVQQEGNAIVYTAEISYPKGKEHLLLSWQSMLSHNSGDFGFHYDPYNFDSAPELDFFQQMLKAINLEPEQVEDIYFTGALTDPRKTDFYVEYKGEDGHWHRYSPDFVVRRKDGRAVIVEIKDERMRTHPTDGEHGRKAMAVQQWTNLNPDRLAYQMIFASDDSVPFNAVQVVKAFMEETK